MGKDDKNEILPTGILKRFFEAGYEMVSPKKLEAFFEDLHHHDMDAETKIALRNSFVKEKSKQLKALLRVTEKQSYYILDWQEGSIELSNIKQKIQKDSLMPIEAGMVHDLQNTLEMFLSANGMRGTFWLTAYIDEMLKNQKSDPDRGIRGIYNIHLGAMLYALNHLQDEFIGAWVLPIVEYGLESSNAEIVDCAVRMFDNHYNFGLSNKEILSRFYTNHTGRDFLYLKTYAKDILDYFEQRKFV